MGTLGQYQSLLLRMGLCSMCSTAIELDIGLDASSLIVDSMVCEQASICQCEVSRNLRQRVRSGHRVRQAEYPNPLNQLLNKTKDRIAASLIL